MAWAIPNYSKTAVSRAGRTHMDPAASATDKELALLIINNWRSSHSFPLNTLQNSLRHKVRAVDPEGLVAQRIKRLPSIEQKLRDRPKMEFARMQDIGGCRGVVQDVAAVQMVVDAFAGSRHKHRLARTDDYITNPKVTGYRGHHLVYRYFSDKNTTYNGMSIEVQVRTRLQHAWATALETVGMFTKQSLKSSQGDADWLRFFALMGSEMAHDEGKPIVPGTPADRRELRREIQDLAGSLDVLNRLVAYGITLRTLETDTAGPNAGRFFVLELSVETDAATLSTQAFSDLAQATDHYSAVERVHAAEPNFDVVLVSVESFSALKRAYPNYYADTATFRSAVEKAIRS